jgi:hypothetical protein
MLVNVALGVRDRRRQVRRCGRADLMRELGGAPLGVLSASSSAADLERAIGGGASTVRTLLVAD